MSGSQHLPDAAGIVDDTHDLEPSVKVTTDTFSVDVKNDTSATTGELTWRQHMTLICSSVFTWVVSIGIIIGVSYACQVQVWLVDVLAVVLAAVACAGTLAAMQMTSKSRTIRMKTSLTLTWSCLLLLVVLSVLLFWDRHYSRRAAHLLFGYSTEGHDPAGRAMKRICFIGDSLIQYTDKDFQLVYHLIAALQTALPSFHFAPIETGVGGNKIADIKARYQRDCLDRRPDSIVLSWQTDADEGNEDVAQYTSDLDEVLSAFSAAVPPGHVIVAGPTLYGELPRGQNRYDSLFETYVDVNTRVAAEHNVTYVSTRDVFFNILEATHWTRPYGALTQHDEMHHNANGAAVQEAVLRGLLFNVYDA